MKRKKGRNEKKEDICYCAYSLPISFSGKGAVNMAHLQSCKAVALNILNNKKLYNKA